MFLGVAIWAVQEWAIHKHLFHGDIDWFGKAIHTDHHKAPYYHISIDDAFIAVGVMLLSTATFTVTLGARCGMDASLGCVYDRHWHCEMDDRPPIRIYASALC